jgi:hypothetical protein
MDPILDVGSGFTFNLRTQDPKSTCQVQCTASPPSGAASTAAPDGAPVPAAAPANPVWACCALQQQRSPYLAAASCRSATAGFHAHARPAHTDRINSSPVLMLWQSWRAKKLWACEVPSTLWYIYHLATFADATVFAAR